MLREPPPGWSMLLYAVKLWRHPSVPVRRNCPSVAPVSRLNNIIWRSCRREAGTIVNMIPPSAGKRSGEFGGRCCLKGSLQTKRGFWNQCGRVHAFFFCLNPAGEMLRVSRHVPNVAMCSGCMQGICLDSPQVKSGWIFVTCEGSHECIQSQRTSRRVACATCTSHRFKHS